jgi:hypothetical protein
MTQTIIVGAIVLLAAGCVGRAIYRRLTGKNKPCPSCGDPNCQFSKDPQRHCPINWEM